jgi:hypothetical protein
MTPTNVQAIELIRQIRDQHYEILKDKSREEIKAFFHREAVAANAEAEQLLEQERPTTTSRAEPGPGRAKKARNLGSG